MSEVLELVRKAENYKKKYLSTKDFNYLLEYYKILKEIDSRIESGEIGFIDLKAVQDWVSQAGKQIQEGVSWLSQQIQSGTQWLVSQVTKTGEAATKVVTPSLEWLRQYVDNGIKWTQNQVSNSVNWFVEQAKAVLGDLWNQLEKIPGFFNQFKYWAAKTSFGLNLKPAQDYINNKIDELKKFLVYYSAVKKFPDDTPGKREILEKYAIYYNILTSPIVKPVVLRLTGLKEEEIGVPQAAIFAVIVIVICVIVGMITGAWKDLYNFITKNIGILKPPAEPLPIAPEEEEAEEDRMETTTDRTKEIQTSEVKNVWVVPVRLEEKFIVRTNADINIPYKSTLTVLVKVMDYNCEKVIAYDSTRFSIENSFKGKASELAKPWWSPTPPNYIEFSFTLPDDNYCVEVDYYVNNILKGRNTIRVKKLGKKKKEEEEEGNIFTALGKLFKPFGLTEKEGQALAVGVAALIFILVILRLFRR